MYAEEQNISYPFKTSINPVDKTNVWKTFNGRKIEFEHPPLTEIKVTHFDRTIRASPYKSPNDDDSANIKNIIQQNNFINTHLHTIGDQLARIEQHIQKPVVSDKTKVVHN